MNQNFRYYLLVLLLTIFSLFSCTNHKSSSIKIGFSQAMSTDDWRKQMNNSMKIEASLWPEVDLKISDAQNNVEKQISDIEKFINEKVDVIIVSAIESKPLTAIVEKSIKAGIPVLVIDRKIDSENYTAYIGADNIEIGRIAARYIISHTKGSGKIIEITGAKGSSPAYERSLGFNQIVSGDKNVKLVETIQGNWEKESIKEPLKNYLLNNSDVEYVFAQNDRMALSAWETAKTLGLEDKIKFIGVDGLNTVNGGIELVKSGVLEGTVLYPTGGNEVIKLALKIYNNEAIAKNNNLNTIIIDKYNAEIIENQMDKVDQQQLVIENQQSAINVQEKEYASQNNLIRLLSFFLVIILSLAIYSIYSTIFISRKKKELEQINKTVVDQKDEIEKLAKIARKSTKARLNFFTGLSHEFKTPITLIMSYVESLVENDKIKGTDLIDEMKLIHKNSSRLLRMITQLLDFRKIEEQKFTLRASKTNIYSFTNEIMTDFRGEAARRNINFILISESKNIELFIDHGLMDKVYFNLLSNAFKFTPDNGSITIAIKEVGNDSVKIFFKDSGIGIPETELNNVFSAFFRASNNNKSSSGIGLHLSKEFILLHHGQIDLKSKHGTEFCITLLKGSKHLKASEIVELTEVKKNISNLLLDDFANETDFNNNKFVPDAEKLNLLLIEDNQDLVDFLHHKLTTEYNVFTSNGKDAIEIALETVPDIVICDINLVDKDGFEISKILKKDLRTSHIPIIILSAQSTKESILKGLQSGVDQYITKPFSLAILKQSISSLLFNREKLRYYYTNNIYRIEPESKFGNQEQIFITKMNEIIKSNFEDPKFSVEELADKLNLSRVQLYRKVKAIIGINISDHINNIKLEKAAELLKANQMNISEIAYSLGFSTPNYFSTAFKNKFGVSPKEYKNEALG